MRFLRSYSGFSCSGFFTLLLGLLLAVSVYGQNAEPEVVLTLAGDLYPGGHLEKILCYDHA